MRIFSKEEMKIIYYILGKDINDKWLSEEELKFVKDFDFTDKNLPGVAKQIWDNRNNPKLLTIFVKIAEQENETKIAKTIDKLVKRKGDKHMNDIMIFKNDNFGEIRSLEVDGEPYFVAKDACDILELKNTTMAISRLDKDEVTKFNLGGLSGETNIVNEYGLYNLILASRKKEAKAFKRWITHEVIPSIRKNGSYSLDTNRLMKQLTESQITLNNVLAGFKMQIDNDFKVANEKINKHDELLKKRVYINPVEAKRIQEAVKEKAKQIAIDNNLQYHTVKSKLFARLYDKLKNKFNVATYRELPSFYFDDIMKSINKLSIYIQDLKEEQYQMSM